jgi:hypothetical protein
MARTNLLAITCALMVCSLRAVAQDPSPSAAEDLSGEAVRAMGDVVMGAAIDEQAAVEGKSESGRRCCGE